MRIGGVPEHFSLPFRLALEKGRIKDVEFVDQFGGTGEMVKNLASGTLDLAVALTEGLICAQDSGALTDVEIVSVFVSSALQWGVHVSLSLAEQIKTIDDLKTINRPLRVAISRPYSGSHLMAFVFARKHGFSEAALEFVSVGGLSGALKAFDEGRVDVFLWDRFMTAPIVAQGKHFSRIGCVESPWPCFVVAASKKSIEKHGKAIHDMLSVVLDEAKHMAENIDESIGLLCKRYNLSEEVAREWLASTQYAKAPQKLDENVARTIRNHIPAMKAQ